MLVFLCIKFIGKLNMSKRQDDDTRYFVEINLASLQLIRVGFEQKQNINKGRQTNSDIHRLFVTKGQYNKFVERCSSELESILDC